MAKAYKNYTQKHVGILNAAEHLFLAHGYDATSMDAIARQATVTKQTVYRYFPSKADLFAALIQRGKEQSADFSFGDAPVQDELNRYAQAFLTMHMDKKKIEMFRLMLCESRKNSEIGEIFHQQAQPQWKNTLCAFLAERLKMTDSDLSAEMFNAMLLFLRPGIIMGQRSIPNSDEIIEYAERATQIFYQGIARR